MNLAQIRTLVEVANDAIDNFAASNDAFESQRARERDYVELEQVGELPAGLTAFQFRSFGVTHTVVLDSDFKVVAHEVEKIR